jgi:predicted GNAT superfamily acetyltransferase
VLCAFEKDRMIGFAYGFPGYEHNRPSLHSHMLAVKQGWRNFQVGFYLKLAQRQRMLEQGISEITWTFDPLQSLNAHLNFTKLGVTSRRYIVNFYGEATSSPLHQGFGTDRLWVNWLIESDGVKQRIELKGSSPQAKTLSPDSINLMARTGALLVRAEGEFPQVADLTEGLPGKECLIEIPHNITELKQKNPDAGIAWRKATRAAFLAAIDAGYLVESLFKLDDAPPRWFYSLTR